jgi:NHLM bacteriocin system ABC transporter ATP-binding protein
MTAPPFTPVDSSVRAHYLASADVVDVGSDQPFALVGDVTWLIERGFVDVFLVTTDAHGETGLRTHMARLSADAMLFGFGAQARVGAGLIAVAGADTRLRRLSVFSLRAAVESSLAQRRQAPLVASDDVSDVGAINPLHVAFVVHAGRWATSLVASFPDTAAPRSVVTMEHTGALSLVAGALTRPDHELVWVDVQGSALLAGRTDLQMKEGIAYPIPRALWLKAVSACTLRAITPDSLGDRLWPSLVNLQAMAIWAASSNARRAIERAEVRRARLASENTSAIGSALRSLSGAMRWKVQEHRASHSHSMGDRSYAALLAAMRAVAATAGIEITPPPVDAWIGAEDPVDAIARSSRCRTRRVTLVGKWWHRDAGSLLGFLDTGATRESVALLPRPGGGYDMHRWEHGVVRVTATTASMLIASAVTIYRPFPSSALAIRDVLRFALHGCWRDIALAGVLGAVGGALATVVPFSIGLLFDTVIPGADRSQLMQLTIVLIVIAVAGTLFELVRTVALLRVEGRMQVTVQAALWDRLLELPATFFRTFTVGDLAVRAMSIDGIRQLLTGSVTTALVGGVFSVFNLAMMFVYSAALAWRGVAVIAASLLITLVVGWLQLSTQRKVSLMRGRTSGLVVQLLTSIAKLRVAGAEVRAFAIWARYFGEQRRQQFRSRFIRNAYGAMNVAIPTIALMIIYATASNLMEADALSLARGVPPEAPLRTGAFLAFVAAFTACLGGTLATGAGLLTAAGIIPLYEQARPILTAIPEVSEGQRSPGFLEGDIEVQHLRFRYMPDGPLVLNDLSFHIRPGECIALVGPSGSGKSSIIRALLGFEKLETGTIYLDGQDMSGLDLRAVRRQIGVVLQQSRLNAGDIYANIVGSSLATEGDAWQAAEMAGLADDIRAMPMGMNTVISEGAGTLSGGQRQRLMIARAFVRRPKIVIFDEATSALDNHAQAIVSESLARLRATRIIVAHRLSTVLSADRILVVKNGEIAEQGSYAELMHRNAVFADLARRQLA